MSNDNLEKESICLAEKHSSNIAEEILNEIKRLKGIHEPSFGKDQLKLLDSTSRIRHYKLENFFSNICFNLRICLTILVIAAFAERTISRTKTCEDLPTLKDVAKLFC